MFESIEMRCQGDVDTLIRDVNSILRGNGVVGFVALQGSNQVSNQYIGGLSLFKLKLCSQVNFWSKHKFFLNVFYQVSLHWFNSCFLLTFSFYMITIKKDTWSGLIKSISERLSRFRYKLLSKATLLFKVLKVNRDTLHLIQPNEEKLNESDSDRASDCYSDSDTDLKPLPAALHVTKGKQGSLVVEV